MRGTGARGLAAEAGLRPDKRGPRSEIADKRSATGRADGGSIHPRRILAQWMRISGYAPRGAPLPLVFDACVRARAGISAVWFQGEARGTPLPYGRRAGMRDRRSLLNRDGAVAPCCCDGRPSSGAPRHLLPSGRREEAALFPRLVLRRGPTAPAGGVTRSWRGRRRRAGTGRRRRSCRRSCGGCGDRRSRPGPRSPARRRSRPRGQCRR